MRRWPGSLLILLPLTPIVVGCGATDAPPGAAVDPSPTLAVDPSPTLAGDPSPTLAATPVEPDTGGGLVADGARAPEPALPTGPERAVVAPESVGAMHGNLGDVGLGASPLPGKSEGDTSRPPEPVILSSAEVLGALGEVLAGGAPPNDLMWRSRAAAACDHDPKLSEQIVDRALAEGTTPAGREFAASILTSHPNSQAALRRLLSAPQVRGDPQLYALVSQLHRMALPEDATVDLVLSLRKSDDFMLHSIATSVLGHQVATLLSGGRKDAAVELAGELQAAFTAETEVAERALLLAAIGAGGLPETLPFVRRFVRAKEPELRVAAAKGLNLDTSAKGGNLLLQLVVDPEPDVQAAAIESLHYHPLSAAQQRTFHRAIMADRVRPPSDGVLVHVIDKRLVGAAREEALLHLLERNKDNWVTRHINNVLAL